MLAAACRRTRSAWCDGIPSELVPGFCHLCHLLSLKSARNCGLYYFRLILNCRNWVWFYLLSRFLGSCLKFLRKSMVTCRYQGLHKITCVYIHDPHLFAIEDDGQRCFLCVDRPHLAQISMVFHNNVEVWLGTMVKHSWNYFLNYCPFWSQVWWEVGGILFSALCSYALMDHLPSVRLNRDYLS